ncbi:MAG TPA: DegT/DnrJ/EryC1/StrS family aminotransferase [Armatimonadetes bacterium]|nr:DegT/DnrJ/EryC1/StrS family aminotransferase [Armatimonadota bacterium]
MSSPFHTKVGVMSMSRLAIEGGEKTVTLEPPTWPRLHVKEIEAAIDALRIAASGVDDSWEYLCSARGGGPTAEFERKFAQFMGAKYAMATNSGGAALHIAVMASGVEAGDEVIVSPYTWGQSVSCVLQQCAIPVFADIDPKTYTLDPASIEAKITPRTKAIVVVHIYGHPADMDGIMDVARRYGLKVIEDCAQATGAIYKGRRVGTIGDFGCFSIGNGKQIIGGEGGVLLTNDERLYELANVFGQHPMRQQHVVQDDELRRLMDSLIFTYRIHPLAAIIAGVQLNYLDEWNEQRRRNHELLSDGLGDMPGIEPVYTAPECTHVYHIYSPTFIPEEVEGISRDTYIKALQAEGVPISHGYVRMPIHLRPRMREKKYFFGRGYPWAVTPEGQAL